MYRRQLDGIRRYAKSRGWTVEARSCAEAGPEDIPALLAELKPVGCIDACAQWRPGIPRKLFGRTPVCYIAPPNGSPGPKALTVVCDNAAVAVAAFRELSFGLPPAFAVVPYFAPSRKWSRERVAAFQALCHEKRLPCSAFTARIGENDEERAARMTNWAAKLPDRCAIFAVNDLTAREIARALHAAGRPMPRSATLVGADSLDFSPDEGEHPSISSVRIDFEFAGYAAAKILANAHDQSGKHLNREAAPRPQSGHLCGDAALKVEVDSSGLSFGPLLAERRESTQGRGRREPYVMRAVDIIRREACDGLTAAKLASVLPGSRNLFERRFREAMGHSVLEEILHVRFERVFELLSRQEVPIGAISDFCGFPSSNEFHRLFLSRFGMSPGRWRKNHTR